ncbi:MAG TPA: hypothetical protein VFI73_01540 [Candidatus Nitrosopolaris sp.]|nr:hypothetical protein [Candidatus Nitrosopolaris sp.]
MNRIHQKILPTKAVSVIIGMLFIFVSKLFGLGFIFVAGLTVTLVSKTKCNVELQTNQNGY